MTGWLPSSRAGHQQRGRWDLQCHTAVSIIPPWLLSWSFSSAVSERLRRGDLERKEVDPGSWFRTSKSKAFLLHHQVRRHMVGPSEGARGLTAVMTH